MNYNKNIFTNIEHIVNMKITYKRHKGKTKIKIYVDVDIAGLLVGKHTGRSQRQLAGLPALGLLKLTSATAPCAFTVARLLQKQVFRHFDPLPVRILMSRKKIHTK